jgi:hypothetical protein
MLSRKREDISTLASGCQSFLSGSLAPNLPVFPLALTAVAIVAAESLSRALNFKERPTLGIGENAKVPRLKKFPPKYAVQ